jgi:hypothetical protein
MQCYLRSTWQLELRYLGDLNGLQDDIPNALDRTVDKWEQLQAEPVSPAIL